jgi:hypothetical protein
VYNTDYGQLYGLFRRPDAAGLAYWVDVSLQQYGTGESFTNVFFGSVLTSTAIIQWIDSDGRSDAQRSQIFDKAFLRGTAAGVVGDRGTPGGGVSTNLTDSFTVYSNTAVVNYNLVPDYTTEGPETLTINLDNGQASASITVNDTSRTPSQGDVLLPLSIPDPVIELFSWTKTDGVYGDPVAVIWKITEGTADYVTVSISGLGINYNEIHNTLLDNTPTFNLPPISGQITATITAINSLARTKTATTTINVSAVLPNIDYFYSDPASPVNTGDTVFFVFRVSNASRVELTRGNNQVYLSDTGVTGTVQEDSVGATVFNTAQTVNYTLTAENADGDTVIRTISVEAREVASVDPVYWLVEPEWSGLLQSTTVGTTGRGFAQAGGSVDTIRYTVFEPNTGYYYTGDAQISAGEGFYTPNFTFTQTGVHTISMEASGIGGTVTGTDTVNVNTVLEPEYELTPSQVITTQGGIAEFVLTTQNVPNGTLFNVRVNGSLAQSNLPINNGTLNIRLENLLAGTFTVAVEPGGQGTVATAQLVVEAAAATYTLSPITPTVTSGQPVTYNLTTTNVTNGTTIYFKFVNSLNGAEIYTLEDTVLNNSASITFDTTGISTGIYSLEIFNTVYDGVVATSGTLRVDPVVPTYSLLPSSMTKVDGESIGVFTLSTTDVSDGTEVYVTIDKASNGSTRSVSSPTINNNSASFNITLAQGTLTPASDYSVNVRTGSYTGPIVASSALTITAAPTYQLSTENAIVASNTNQFIPNIAFFTVTTTNVPSGTQLYWHIGPNSNANVADAQGVITIGSNGTSQFAYTPSTAELDDVFTVYLKTGGQSGTIVDTVTITVIIATDEGGFFP